MPVNLNMLGALQKDGTIELFDKGRDYKRILTTPEQRSMLRKAGFQHTISSFIIGVKEVGNDLVIVFKNGSQYLYNNVGKLIDKMLNSPSRGKYFWRHIRDKVGFTKLSSTIDLGVSAQSDEDMFREFASKDLNNINKVIKKVVNANLVTLAGMSYMRLDVGGIIMYQAVKLNN